MRESGTTEMVINEELSLNVAPLPRIGETKDFDCNSIANAQSRTMAAKETHFRRKNAPDEDLHENIKSLSQRPPAGLVSSSQCVLGCQALQNAYDLKTDFVAEAKEEFPSQNEAVSIQNHSS